MSKEMEAFKEIERGYLHGTGGDFRQKLKEKYIEPIKQALERLEAIEKDGGSDFEETIELLCDEVSDVYDKKSFSKYYNKLYELSLKSLQQARELERYKNVHIGIDCSKKDFNTIMVFEKREDKIYVIYSKDNFNDLSIKLKDLVGGNDE